MLHGFVIPMERIKEEGRPRRVEGPSSEKCVRGEDSPYQISGLAIMGRFSVDSCEKAFSCSNVVGIEACVTLELTWPTSASAQIEPIHDNIQHLRSPSVSHL
jgi:hypothetical protein